ncbi:hypothetical protein J5069_11355 [Candidatus Symbiopectobacterium sp. NZEC127]|nr:hypothetical protein [Candidatus Symbiopectobacterium sp. NZEC127]MCW2486493.1 hypothetical protein [Candidatus Symbiopectobacterium sp. NZEC127]
MKEKNNVILKEITNELVLSFVSGGNGTGNPAPTGSGTCVGGPIGGSRG